VVKSSQRKTYPMEGLILSCRMKEKILELVYGGLFWWNDSEKFVNEECDVSLTEIEDNGSIYLLGVDGMRARSIQKRFIDNGFLEDINSNLYNSEVYIVNRKIGNSDDIDLLELPPVDK